MFTRVEACHYRCLHKVDQALGRYQVLVGPNASGKSNFLDVISFLGDLVTLGTLAATGERSDNFHDLVWGREGTSFSLAVEAKAPASITPARKASTIRYAVTIKIETASDQVLLSEEQLSLVSPDGSRSPIITRQDQRVTYRAEEGDFQTEFLLGPTQPGLLNLPPDRTRFPSATWLKDLLTDGIQLVVLDNDYLGGSSPPGQGKPKLFNGGTLARRVSGLADNSPDRFKAWVRHIQTALSDIETVRTVLRPEDKHRYLMVKYRNGIEVPGWALSSGTLRLLALTVLAYVPEPQGVYLIEEPEVGVHPSAFETIIQSLSSIYDGQVVITTHAPLLVGMSERKDLLCFSKTDEGTEIVSGDQHPRLEEWQSGLEISDLFAAGILG
jgi:predicted ATPase